MRAALIDYGSGNIASAAKALSRAAQDSGHEIVVTADPDMVRQSERIVLPGVGHFVMDQAAAKATELMLAHFKKHPV